MEVVGSSEIARGLLGVVSTAIYIVVFYTFLWVLKEVLNFWKTEYFVEMIVKCNV